MADPGSAAAETPDAVEAVSQTRGGGPSDAGPAPAGLQEGEDQLYRVDPRVLNAARTRLGERRPGDPIYRPLEIFALNPQVSKLAGGVVSLEVPYEPLEPGPVGSVVAVCTRDAGGRELAVADLEHPFVLMGGGYRASMSRPEFHQQMVYAIAMLTYSNFTTALGRTVAWGFRPPDDPDAPNRLVLRPHGAEDENAWYDSQSGEIVFGYFRPRHSTPIVQKDTGHLFTSLSHDIIAHEMSHALLDGMRAHFNLPTHPQCRAFHEAFADLIAFFQHFTFQDVVSAQIGDARGRLDRTSDLIHIAREFGRGLGLPNGALRTVVDGTGDGSDDQGTRMKLSDEVTEPHALGRVLVYAVFDAFLTIYNRKARRYIKLATGGTGTLPEGDLPHGLQEFLVGEARDLANQFLKICIRAIDYCPPVDVRFGDYLRALITADRDVVPDDKWAYREAIIQAFGARGIYGEATPSMTEDALAWSGPSLAIRPRQRLSFGKMRFEVDPARPASAAEMHIHAGIVGRLVSHPDLAREFGLVSPSSPEFAGGDYDLPVVNSVRPLRRIGPDQQVVFDIVAEVTQRRRVVRGGREMPFVGGSTIIFGARGDARFIISKHVDRTDRIDQQFAFMTSEAGKAYWTATPKGYAVDPAVVRRMCAGG